MAKKKSPSRKHKTLRQVTKTRLGAEHIDDFIDELVNGTDRSCALVGAAVVDAGLTEFIVHKFVPLTPRLHKEIFDHPFAPLSSFSSKIKIAFALGAIDKSVKDILTCIKDIRNAFAHSAIPLKFTTPEVAKACLKLATSCVFPGGCPHDPLEIVHLVRTVKAGAAYTSVIPRRTK